LSKETFRRHFRSILILSRTF